MSFHSLNSPVFSVILVVSVSLIPPVLLIFELLVVSVTGFIQASMSIIQGLFKDFYKSLQHVEMVN